MTIQEIIEMWTGCADGGSEGGGEGSGDLSVAEVTVSVVSGGAHRFYSGTPVLSEAADGAPAVVSYSIFDPIPEGESRIFRVPLYKGGCIWQKPYAAIDVAVSGNIEIINDTVYYITGNGTITFSAKQSGGNDEDDDN